MRRSLHRLALAIAGVVACIAATPASADLPDAPTLLADLGVSASDVAQVQAGQIVHHDVQAASDRELTTGLAFEVGIPPTALVGESKRDLLDRVDSTVMASGTITSGGVADFAKVSLGGDASRATAYVTATPGGALNLSAEEIAAFAKLGAGASVADVEQQLRQQLAARVAAYRAKGLAGIAPYARDGGTRSPADELRTATAASKSLAKYAPAAYKALSEYPNANPPGTQEVFRWSQFDAHGTPTIALTHALLVPDGDAWIAVQRQFYVSTGYNCEQAVAAFLPAGPGTVVVYGNRTSTDQITGFGGGAKRSLGSKILASQLESMFDRARKAAK